MENIPNVQDLPKFINDIIDFRNRQYNRNDKKLYELNKTYCKEFKPAVIYNYSIYEKQQEDVNKKN